MVALRANLGGRLSFRTSARRRNRANSPARLQRAQVLIRVHAPGSGNGRGPQSGGGRRPWWGGAGSVGGAGQVIAERVPGTEGRLRPYDRRDEPDDAIVGTVILIGALADRAVCVVLCRIPAGDQRPSCTGLPCRSHGLGRGDAGAGRPAQEGQRQDGGDQAQECASEHEIACQAAMNTWHESRQGASPPQDCADHFRRMILPTKRLARGWQAT